MNSNLINPYNKRILEDVQGTDPLQKHPKVFDRKSEDSEHTSMSPVEIRIKNIQQKIDLNNRLIQQAWLLLPSQLRNQPIAQLKLSLNTNLDNRVKNSIQQILHLEDECSQLEEELVKELTLKIGPFTSQLEELGTEANFIEKWDTLWPQFEPFLTSQLISVQDFYLSNFLNSSPTLVLSPEFCQYFNAKQFFIFLQFISCFSKQPESRHYKFSFVQCDPSVLTLDLLNHEEHFNFKFNRQNLWNAPHLSDRQIKCRDKTFYIYSRFLNKDLSSRIESQLIDSNPILIEWILKSYYHYGNHTTLYSTSYMYQPNDLTLFLHMEELLGTEPTLAFSTFSNFIINYRLKHLNLEPLLKDLTDSLNYLSSSKYPTLAKKMHHLLKKIISFCHESFRKEPYSCLPYLTLIKKYGEGLHSIDISLKGGIAKQIQDFFPHLTKLKSSKPYNSEHLQQLLDHPPEHLTSLILKNPSSKKDFNLDEIFSHLHLEKLELDYTMSYDDQEDEDNPSISHANASCRVVPQTLQHLKIKYGSVPEVNREERDSFFSTLTQAPCLKELILEDMTPLSFNDYLTFLKESKIQRVVMNNVSFYQYMGFPESRKQMKFNLIPLQVELLKKQFPHIDLTIEYDLDPTNGLKYLSKLPTYSSVVSPFSPEQLPDSLITQSVQPSIQIINRILDQNTGNIDHACCEARANASANRYSNILPYDWNSLTSELGFYLNASPIIGPTRKRLATQGPTAHTAADFWAAVLKTNTKVIVMTTDWTENGRDKCYPYCPLQLGSSISYFGSQGRVNISLLKQQIDKGLILRQLQVIQEETGKQSEVYQYQITCWQDHSPVPFNVLTHILGNIKLLEQKYCFSPNDTSLFHCSAGVGRTGTVLACLLMEEILKDYRATHTEQTNSIGLDFNQIIQYIRSQRTGMVQTKEQGLLVVQYGQHLLNQLTV